MEATKKIPDAERRVFLDLLLNHMVKKQIIEEAIGPNAETKLKGFQTVSKQVQYYITILHIQILL